jgi:hypothetical protein
MPTAIASFEVVRVCRVCRHAVSKVGVMPSGYCGLHGCDERGWHYHCGQRNCGCTTSGCWPGADQ